VKGPFRADHVGSLIRPPQLREAQRAKQAGASPADLKGLEDQAIRDAVQLQERAGMAAVTDGEFRRITWRESFFNAVDGYSREKHEPSFGFRLPDGKIQKGQPVPRVEAKLKRRRAMVVDEFRFLKGLTKATPKVTLPAPAVAHFYLGDQMIDKAVYADRREYMADVSAIYREEIADLGRAGCTYLQLDDVSLAVLCDAGFREDMQHRGGSADEAIDLYINAFNDAVRDRPAGMSICSHLCRGNVGQGIGAGGYEPIAERIFNGLDVDGYLLEFDTPRAGDFTPLRFLPKGKRVALGLVSTKVRELESAERLRTRIDEASKYADLEQLCLSTQCGFASGFQFDRLTIEDEERKLALIAETATKVWTQ
jgi:5-methyltetrahydropteroyltriglutamate--homocysteine methyltransferase